MKIEKTRVPIEENKKNIDISINLNMDELDIIICILMIVSMITQ